MDDQIELTDDQLAALNRAYEQGAYDLCRALHESLHFIKENVPNITTEQLFYLIFQSYEAGLDDFEQEYLNEEE